MNKSDKIRYLLSIFGLVHCDSDLFGELFKLIIGSGKETQIIKFLTRAIPTIVREGTNAVNLSYFEILGGTNGLYSLHIKGNGYNLRIICCRVQDSWLMLLCFYEREDSNVSSYNAYIPIALARREKWEKEHGQQV